jgi:hypothetical protein
VVVHDSNNNGGSGGLSSGMAGYLGRYVQAGGLQSIAVDE